MIVAARCRFNASVAFRICSCSSAAFARASRTDVSVEMSRVRPWTQLRVAHSIGEQAAQRAAVSLLTGQRAPPPRVAHHRPRPFAAVSSLFASARSSLAAVRWARALRPA